MCLGVEAMQKLNLGSRNKVNPRNVASFPYIPGMLEDRYSTNQPTNQSVNRELCAASTNQSINQSVKSRV